MEMRRSKVESGDLLIEQRTRVKLISSSGDSSLISEVPFKSKDTRITVLCNHCRWRIINLDLEGEYCHAYPPGETKGIPDRFINGEAVHDKVEEDQKGKLILEPEDGCEDIVKRLKGE